MILIYANVNFASWVKQYVKIVLHLIKGNFGILMREAAPVIKGYELARERIDPSKIIPYYLVDDLTIKKRFLLLFSKKEVIKKAIIQLRIRKTVFDEVKEYVKNKEIDKAKALIDEALDFREYCIRRGLYENDI
jgi:hypothetical protein